MIQNYQFCNGSVGRKILSKTRIILTVLGVSLASIPQPAWTATTTADFLKWDRKAQVFFLNTSVSMAGFIISQTNSKRAKCIQKWYFKSADVQSSRQNQILSEMRRYTEFHPNAVLVSLIERACGQIAD